MPNSDYDFKPNEAINYKEAFRPNIAPKAEPKIDKVISDIVGKPIMITNPKLLKLVAKWKKEKGDSEEFDNFLQDEAKIKELKEIL